MTAKRSKKPSRAGKQQNSSEKGNSKERKVTPDTTGHGYHLNHIGNLLHTLTHSNLGFSKV